MSSITQKGTDDANKTQNLRAVNSSIQYFVS